MIIEKKFMATHAADNRQIIADHWQPVQNKLLNRMAELYFYLMTLQEAASWLLKKHQCAVALLLF